MNTLKKVEAYLNNLIARGIRNLPNSLSFPGLTGESNQTKLETLDSRIRGNDKLEELKAVVLPCKSCSELAKSRKTVVFGAGNPKANLMFVGEAPGFDEDVQGLPFVGKAGQLLTKIIESIGLKREEVYIANVLKCRPPGNRNPLPHEVMNCEPYLKKQISIIKPLIICALGNFAAQTLLKTSTSITRLRGKWSTYEGIQVMPTFHPAYLLRNPEDKRKVWEDMKMIREELKQLTS